MAMENYPALSDFKPPLVVQCCRWFGSELHSPHHAEAGCYYKKKVRYKTLQIQKI